jgi:mannose-6-phosphate isomerase-like protein (cupin superfamily)
METEAFDFDTTYVQLEDGARALPHEVGEDFWSKIEERTDLHHGRLICLCRFDADWPTWEMHPAGDEIVCLLEGAIDLILDEPAGERSVRLRGRAACIVPQGIWHRAIVREPSSVLHITRGAGTQHRAV